PAEAAPSLFVGRPRHLGESSGWSLFLSRPLTLASGFRGVIAAEVPARSFSDYFAAAAPGSGFRIALLYKDGALVASDPPEAAPSGIGMRDPLADAVLGHLAESASGSFELADPDGRDAALVAYRAIDGRPLIVAVSVDTHALLAGWRGEQRGYLALIALIALTIGIFAWALARLLDRRQQHLDELRRNEAKFVQQSALLQRTLEHMGEGLSVFDRNHRLLAWNDRFIALLGLPSGVGKGT